MSKTCYKCGKETNKEMFSFPICNDCKSKLRLLSDAKIKKYYSENPEKFSSEIQSRLEFIEKDYIDKKIKLLYVIEQFSNL